MPPPGAGNGAGARMLPGRTAAGRMKRRPGTCGRAVSPEGLLNRLLSGNRSEYLPGGTLPKLRGGPEWTESMRRPASSFVEGAGRRLFMLCPEGWRGPLRADCVPAAVSGCGVGGAALALAAGSGCGVGGAASALAAGPGCSDPLSGRVGYSDSVSARKQWRQSGS